MEVDKKERKDEKRIVRGREIEQKKQRINEGYDS